MKKILFIVAIALALIVSCKEEKKVKENSATESVSDKSPEAVCETLAAYRILTDVKEKAQWLKDHEHTVCPDTLNKASEDAHFLQFIPVRYSSVTLKKKWSEIKAMMGSDIYSNYLQITKNPISHNITGIQKKTPYDPNGFCFSMPLFRGIDKKYILNNNDEFEFQSATINGKIVVVFTVTRQGNPVPVAYYDYSDRPDKKMNTTTDKKSPL